MIKFSLVMPSYGVEKYIERALESINNQTYDNYEVIIVDDCSPDKTGEISRAYCESHAKFHYYRNETNKRVGPTRNEGLAKATGDYVMFLDPDDYYEPNLLETVAAAANDHRERYENEVDVILYGLVEEYRNENQIIQFTVTHNVPQRQDYNDESFRKQVIELERETLYGYPWNKAFRTAVLRENNLEFPAITHIEDIYFNVKVFDKISSLLLLPDILYHYDQHNQASLTKKYIADYFQLQKTRVNIVMEQQKNWGVYDEHSRTILSNIYHRSFVSAIQREVDVQKRSELRKFVRKEMDTDMYREFKGRSHPNGKAAKILYTLLDTGNITINICAARFIAYVKRKHASSFNKLKQN